MAPIGTISTAAFSYRDFSGEVSRTNLHFAPLDISADNSSLLGALGSISVVGTALNTLTSGVEAGTHLSNKIDVGASGLPTDPAAQRELAFRFKYQDNVTGRFYRFDVPAPNTALITAGSDELDMADLVIAAFKVIFDANCKSIDGHSVTLVSGRVVGRNN